MGYLTVTVLGYFLLLLLTPRMTGSEVSSFYFTMDSYSTKIPSDLRVNESIAQIYTRPLTNKNSSYLLRLAVEKEPNALSREVEEFFAIDQETGQIYLQQPFDSKGNLTGWNFTLQISAWSQRERPREAVDEARMTVEVIDDIPRCTCFDTTRYVFRLRPDSELGAFGILRSSSSCLNANSASFTYSFLTENIGEWLSIDDHTSEIVLLRHPKSSQDGRSINVLCTMVNAEGDSNQTLTETTEILLSIEVVPDYYNVDIRENRSRGDHVAWIYTNNSDAINWQTISVTMAGKHNDTYGVNTLREVSPMATTVSSGERVIGEIVLLRMLPCNMVDHHTITIQLHEGNDTMSERDSTRGKEVVTVLIDVDVHSLLEHHVVINTSLNRRATQYTRVTTLQLPPCISMSTSMSGFKTDRDSFLQVGQTSGIVYLRDVTSLRNLSLTSHTKEIKTMANIGGDWFIAEWEINIEIIDSGGMANCTLAYDGCSKYRSEEECTSHCGYGSPNGVCEWRQQKDPKAKSSDFSTCSPDLGSCPNRECDELEQLVPLLCPQDCVENVASGNLLFMVSLNHNGYGIGQAIGPCWCDLRPDCLCKVPSHKSSTLRVGNVSTTQVSPIDQSNILPRATTTTITARTTRQVYYYNYNPNKSSVSSAEDQCKNCLFIILFCVLVLALVVVVFICTRRGRASPLRRIISGKNYKPPVIIDGSDSRLTSVLSECSDDGQHLNKVSVIRLKTEFDPKWEFSRRNLILDKVLGEGEFGRVVRAQALSLRGHTGYTTVAVKMLKGSYTSDDLQDLITEMNLLKELNHPNVVKLLGASTQKGPLYVIVEYCQYGCLRDFLRQNRQNPTYQDDDCSLNYCKEDGKEVVLNNRDLLSFAWQICKGMQYLAMLKLVHRDLAARNILVTDGLVIKVSDFGLARDTYENGAYIKTSKSRIPMKWMAPESLFDNIYTSKTDIWSFGVLFWEIVTMGAMPYPGMMSHKLCQMLREGYRLERPDGCTDELYAIMQKCWQSDPNDRPDFDMVGVMLERIMEINADYLDLSCEPFGDCSDKEIPNSALKDDKTSSAVPLLQIPTPESTELMPLMKGRLEKPDEKELKEIIVEETDVDSGPLYGDIDSCQLYNNLNFLTDHLCKTVSEPNLGSSQKFQE